MSDEYQTYRSDSIKIFRDFLASLIFPIDILGVTTNDDQTITLKVCRLLHAQPNFDVTIGGNNYKITAIDDDANTITVSGSQPITVNLFELYKPYFFYGTPIQTGMELNQESKVNTPHVPMLYLRPDNDIDNNDLSPTNKKVNGDLYFLTKANNLEWLNEKSYQQGVRPMRRLQQYFVDQMIERGVSIFDILPAEHSFKVSDYPKFGVYVSEKGQVQSKWTDQLSGCGMPLDSLGIWDDGLCHDC